jgi:Icc-related predicted phosphoesterase
VKTLKIVAISDTHNRQEEIKIPECDILLHAGDYTLRGHDDELNRFFEWLGKQPAKHKVMINGNHEVGFEANPKNGHAIAQKHCPGVEILFDRAVTVEGVKIWGTPVTPWFYDWAYNRARNEHEAAMYNIPLISEHYKNIPKDTNIILTHGPAYGILDELTYVDGTPKGQFVGCEDLLEKINEIKPDIHICGHIHCAHGEKHINGTSFYNAAVCDEMYWPSNPITIIEYVKG